MRAAVLADSKRQEETKKGPEDSSSVQDQHQQPTDAAVARQSTISSTQAGLMAAALAPVTAAAGAAGRASMSAGAGGVRAAELAKAEAAYKALEAEFKEQLQLA